MSDKKLPPIPSAATQGGKLPGKSEFSGRRRSATRTSGHHSHPDATGGELRREEVAAIAIRTGEKIELVFSAPAYPAGQFVAFGGWFATDVDVQVSFSGTPGQNTLVTPRLPNWGKLGSMWLSDGKPLQVVVTFRASANGRMAFWKLDCGRVEHEFLTNARTALLKNMYEFSPEAHFIAEQGTVVVRRVSGGVLGAPAAPVLLASKCCNRCARFLPVNVDDQRIHLSFSNHCVASHRRPCRHTGFGRLRDVDSGEIVQLEYGYQLECRFCKKFAVNAAHNVQRTGAQMKEDGARRRSIELLLGALYGASSPQLRYRHEHGRELTDYIWQRFKKKCFNCGLALPTAKSMRLDHTRPLALLWPLDGTATALCTSCNSQKRDRPPAEFYNDEQLVLLAAITGLPLKELSDPSPNVAAVKMLSGSLDWFFKTFLTSPLLVKVRDGKTAAELLVKALQKTINKCPTSVRFDLEGELSRRRGT